jgi:hypothetical protein
MKGLRQAAAVVFVFFFGGAFVTPAGQSPFRVSDQQLEQLTVRLWAHSESFNQSVKVAIAGSFLNNAPIGVYMKSFVQEFYVLTDRLKMRSKDRKPVSSDVQEALNRAEYINSFMNSYDLGPQAERDWLTLREDLDQLASYYRIKTRWNAPVQLGVPKPVKTEAMENRLIGTYKLEKPRNDDLQKMVRRALGDMPIGARARLQITLMRHLREAKFVAIDREGGKVTFGSSLQPARVYEVAGRAQTDSIERLPTLLYGGQFRVNTGSDDDGLYSVTFGATNLGSRLEVIRTALLNRFKRPIVVISYYTKISDAAEFDLSEEEDVTPPRASGNGVLKKK